MAFNGIESPDRPVRPLKTTEKEYSSVPMDDDIVERDEATSNLDEQNRLLCNERLELSSPILWPEQGKLTLHF